MAKLQSWHSYPILIGYEWALHEQILLLGVGSKLVY